MNKSRPGLHKATRQIDFGRCKSRQGQRRYKNRIRRYAPLDPRPRHSPCCSILQHWCMKVRSSRWGSHRMNKSRPGLHKATRQIDFGRCKSRQGQRRYKNRIRRYAPLDPRPRHSPCCSILQHWCMKVRSSRWGSHRMNRSRPGLHKAIRQIDFGKCTNRQGQRRYRQCIRRSSPPDSRPCHPS